LPPLFAWLDPTLTSFLSSASVVPLLRRDYGTGPTGDGRSLGLCGLRDDECRIELREYGDDRSVTSLAACLNAAAMPTIPRDRKARFFPLAGEKRGTASSLLAGLRIFRDRAGDPSQRALGRLFPFFFKAKFSARTSLFQNMSPYLWVAIFAPGNPLPFLLMSGCGLAR
jgi:hypothetical protein